MGVRKDKEMNFYYLIAVLNKGDNRLYYLVEDRTLNEFSNVLDAIRFCSYEEALKYALDESVMQFLDMGFCLVKIADCTLEKARKDIKLFSKLHDPYYVL